MPWSLAHMSEEELVAMVDHSIEQADKGDLIPMEESFAEVKRMFFSART